MQYNEKLLVLISHIFGTYVLFYEPKWEKVNIIVLAVYILRLLKLSDNWISKMFT